MCLDKIIQAQNRGEAKGITAICSAHPWVLKAAMQQNTDVLLIESTCNQVNQYGGYTGMVPAEFVRYLREIAEANHFPFKNIILGGDHLGPNIWRNEPAEWAMQKAEVMIHDYVKAGFAKIHLDCSMSLADDPVGGLDVEVAAARAARLAKVAERSGNGNLRYVIGTDVPIPGGATEHEDRVRITDPKDARETIEIHLEAFRRFGLQSAWERVIAVVVQPGVEFGDDFVLPYLPGAARELSRFIEGQLMIYEVHSTDFQTRQALKDLVHDHFAILKVGPALTFAYREGVFALAMIENEWISRNESSNFIQVLERTMTAHSEHWREYYQGTEQEQAFKRKFSLSDRVRYYWGQPEVQRALNKLMHNLGQGTLPYSLSSQFLGETGLTAEQALDLKIRKVLQSYRAACEETSEP
jgi:D-tagatose-1,6-bisphosphate aldolase subunit GatZ/KbaZ